LYVGMITLTSGVIGSRELEDAAAELLDAFTVGRGT
jgi:hypothetical protein